MSNSKPKTSFKAIGQLHTLPVTDAGGVILRSHPVQQSLSLASAQFGEYCPIFLTEIETKPDESRLRYGNHLFIRTEVENRLIENGEPGETIEAWLRT